MNFPKPPLIPLTVHKLIVFKTPILEWNNLTSILISLYSLTKLLNSIFVKRINLNIARIARKFKTFIFHNYLFPIVVISRSQIDNKHYFSTMKRIRIYSPEDNQIKCHWKSITLLSLTKKNLLENLFLEVGQISLCESSGIRPFLASCLPTHNLFLC